MLSGSVPKSLPKDIYAQIAKLAQTKGVRLIVDAAGDLLLSTLEFQPFLVKPNREELSEMFRAPADTEEQVTALAGGAEKTRRKKRARFHGGRRCAFVYGNGRGVFCPGGKGHADKLHRRRAIPWSAAFWRNSRVPAILQRRSPWARRRAAQRRFPSASRAFRKLWRCMKV